MAIKIERFSQDQLERQMWFFIVNINFKSEFKIILSDYFEQERKTRRHKFINKKENRTYRGERCQGTTMKREDIPLPQEVIIELNIKLKNEIEKAVNKAISKIG